MKNIEQSECQLAALRAAYFCASRLEKHLPDSNEFEIFGFGKFAKECATADKKSFFKKMEGASIGFFMEWFSADINIDLSVRRRVALHAIKNGIDGGLWGKIGADSEFPRFLDAAQNAFEEYKKMEKKRLKSTDMFLMGMSDQFYKEKNLLAKAIEKGGFISCDESLLIELAHRHVAIETTAQINSILHSLGESRQFVYSAPLVEGKTLEARLKDYRDKTPTIIKPLKSVISYE